MSSGIYVALSGARAQEKALDTTARNIANASTTGFKAERMSFAESFAVAQSPDQRYVAANDPVIDLGQGPIHSTGNPLDMAIDGRGFFALQTEAGERYTRDGSFRVNADGTLVTALGHPVLDDRGDTIDMPPDTGHVEVSPAGEIRADGQSIATLKLVTFEPEALARVGDNMFSANAEPSEDVDAQVIGESLEGSNFNTVRGVIDVIQANRTFQALTKMIEGYKETEGRAARNLGGPR